MQWEDKALVINMRKFSERDMLVSVFSREHGIYRAIVKGGMGKKQRGTWQVGNLVHANWNARLQEHMGNLHGELLTPFAALAMDDRKNLAAISSCSALIEAAMMERDPHLRLFDVLHELFSHIVEDAPCPWEMYYAWFEYVLLQELGFALDMSECAATGVTENLTYISPKSGRAVCTDAGRPYHDRMLILPNFLREAEQSQQLPEESTVKRAEVLDSLKLTGYFLAHWLFESKGRKLPTQHVQFIDYITRDRHPRS